MLSRLALVLAMVAACGDNLRYDYDDLVDVTGGNPYPFGCGDTTSANNAPVPGQEVEPSLAVDPASDTHLVAAWQQNRWSTGGADGTGTAVSFDAGKTWTHALPKFSRCAGGSFARTSDPWVAVDRDGTVYVESIGLDGSDSHSAVLVATSSDGGRSWGEPTALIDDDDPDVFNDKDSITADPHVAGRAYAVWDRLTGLSHPDQPIGTGPAMFARATNGTWEPARAIFDPGVNAQTIGNIVAVLPDGTLVDVFTAFHDGQSHDIDAMPTTDIQVLRSMDGGTTWSAPIEVAPQASVGVPNLRTGDGLPELAVDPASGALYVAWEDSAFSQNTHDGIVVAHSTDGGQTWSAPVVANGAPDVPAFTPQIAVAADGTAGAFYYDLRADGRATAWLATSHDGGATWSDEQLSGAFDQTIATVGGVAFLGDYEGLAARGTDLVPLFAVAFRPEDPTDIFVRP